MLEDVDHLFFSCKNYWPSWMKGFEWWVVNGVLHKDVQVNILAWKGMV